MKINRQVIQSILGFLCILLLLAPLTVLAQTKVVVIPLFGDDAEPLPKPLKNIITVAKANGNFTDPVAAVNSITDASASNPYLVVIWLGEYTITQTLQMKPYVDIVGGGENVTKIKGAISTKYDNSSAIISGADNCALSFLTVENTGGGDYSIGLYNYNASPRVSHATITASGGRYQNIGVYNFASSQTMNNVTVTASGGGDCYGVYSLYGSPTMNNVTVTNTSSGAIKNYGVYNDSSSPTMSNVSVTTSGFATDTYAVLNRYSSLTMTNVTATASAGIYTYGVYNSSSFAAISRSTMKGNRYSLVTHNPGGDTGKATVSQSTLIGPVSGGTGNECFACDNGSGTVLDENCLAP